MYANVKIKLLHPNAKVPTKAHQSDFCYDLTCVTCEEIAPNVYRYGFGIALELEPVHNALLGYYEMLGSFQIRPRSSIWRTGMVMSNSMGTIDINYRGELSTVMYHVMPSMPRYQVGERIAQLLIETTIPANFTIVDALSDTDRGTCGYGSTGK